MANKIKNRSYNCDYFFVKPAAKKDVYKTAKKLIGIDRVREVVVTEGDFGFVVKADPSDNEGNDPLHTEIMKIVGGSSNKAVCLCQYSKK